MFGSMLRDDFGPDSDVDLLIDPEPGRLKTVHSYVAARDAFVALYGRPVDLVKRSLVESSPNDERRREILESARVIYDA